MYSLGRFMGTIVLHRDSRWAVGGTAARARVFSPPRPSKLEGLTYLLPGKTVPAEYGQKVRWKIGRK